MTVDELEGGTMASQRPGSDLRFRDEFSRRNRGDSVWLKWNRSALCVPICVASAASEIRGSQDDIRMHPPSDGNAKDRRAVPLAGRIHVCKTQWECSAVVAVVQFRSMHRFGGSTHRRGGSGTTSIPCCDMRCVES